MGAIFASSIAARGNIVGINIPINIHVKRYSMATSGTYVICKGCRWRDLATFFVAWKLLVQYL